MEPYSGKLAALFLLKSKGDKTMDDKKVLDGIEIDIPEDEEITEETLAELSDNKGDDE